MVLNLLLILNSERASGQLNANFATNPTHSNNQISVCAGSTILFTFISTGSNITATTQVNWTFTTNSGTSLSMSSSTLRTPFPLTFPNGIYNVTLTLSEPNGSTSTKSIIVTATSIPPSYPNISLDATSISAGWSSNPDNTIFTICPINLTVSQDVIFNITSLNCSPNPTITLTDLNVNGNIDCSAGIIENTYNPVTSRFYYSVFTVQFSGCTFSRVHYIQIGTPSISITSASATACDPGTYSLAFTDQTPGVTYHVDWDYNGSTFNAQSVYTYPNLPLNPQKISHTYSYTPCIGNLVQPNEIVIRAFNTCSGYSESNPSDVYVSQSPNADFSRTPNLDVICQGTQVIYSDISTAGVYVSSAGCSSDYHRWWTHTGPAFGATTSNTSNVSNLGSSSGSNPGPATFTWLEEWKYIKLLEFYNSQIKRLL